MALGLANRQDNVLLFEAVVKLFQDPYGISIHIHDSLGIDQGSGNRRLGGVNELASSVGEMVRVEEQERTGKSLHHEAGGFLRPGDRFMRSGQPLQHQHTAAHALDHPQQRACQSLQHNTLNND